MNRKYLLGNVGYGEFNSYKDINIYSIWTSMFERCYSEEFQNKKPSYIGCTIVDDWWNFQNFARWYVEQKKQEGWHLDKDLLKHGNKIYGPDTCCLIPITINNALLIKKQKSELPTGVSPSNKGYRVKINKFGKQTHIGVYSSLEDAKLGYKLAKEQYLKEVAEAWKYEIPENVYNALINYEIDINLI